MYIRYFADLKSLVIGCFTRKALYRLKCTECEWIVPGTIED